MPRQYGRRFADDIFKFIFLNEKMWLSIEISLKFGPKLDNSEMNSTYMSIFGAMVVLLNSSNFLKRNAD